ncbi:hypothetical protein OHA21_10160 [Actinoplanes sp. NBC_00393]|uniref:hypothetical protein n=1 Tax=Actinoplanes sp. NBC_00393 TaxID=2975953 RepID=UPI002E1C14B6
MAWNRVRTAWVAAAAALVLVAAAGTFVYFRYFRAEEQLPVGFTIAVEPDSSSGNRLWAFPAGTVDDTPDGCGTAPWAQQNGGRDYQITEFVVTIGAHTEPLLLAGADVVADRTPPQAVDVFGCRDDERTPAAFLHVNLNENEALWATSTADAFTTEPLERELAPGASEQIRVRAIGADNDYTWRLDLHIAFRDRQVVHRIDNNGQPFVTVDAGPGSRDLRQ